MTAHELYENAAKIRDDFSDNYGITLGNECISLFTQMLAATLKNQIKKDELPEVFYLNHLVLSTDSVKILMTRLGLNVNVKLIHTEYTRGNYFEITQI